MMGPGLLASSWVTTLANLLALFGGVMFLLGSVIAFYSGWNRRQFTSLVEETPKQPIEEMRGDGTVRLRGEITPQSAADTFTAPIKDEEDCVLAAWEIEEMDDSPKTKSWEKAAWGVTAVPFYISDGTEKILVDITDEAIGNNTDDTFTPETILAEDGVSIEGLRCEFTDFEVQVETDYEESPPDRIAEFETETDAVSKDPMTTGLSVEKSKRKYREQTLQPGDEISILGTPIPQRDGLTSPEHPGDLQLTQESENTLYLSERPFDEFPDGTETLVFGVIIGVIGILHLLAWFVF